MSTSTSPVFAVPLRTNPTQVIPLRRQAICWLLLIAFLFPIWEQLAGSCAAEDVVTLFPKSDGDSPTQVRGTVVDFSGQTLVLQTRAGRTSIPTAKVQSIQTDYGPSYQQGLKLLATSQSNEAVRAFEAAAAAESRPWVRREILANQAIALHNAGRIVEAGNTFLKIVEDDPQTVHLDAIPLAWFGLPPDFERDRAARTWLTMPSPHAQLLGASWLLGTSDRSQAIEILGTLRRSNLPQIALLAEAQLWQTKIVTVTADEVAQWEKQLAAGILRGAALAGPTLVVGKAWRQLDNDAQAALTLMRPPILYPDHRPVAAESLVQAGRSLERSGKTEDARRVIGEVLQKYGDQPARQEAETTLKRLANSGSN
ncbi:tetratricopeptide repeat protein [Blastopirellula marina]|uniref:tetratricopeptide repeat protein n=1 Tax=Blastopirellula marina TaxID=124 RepID=UPI0011B0AD1E|nr:hypothetical protein [Blastopirellula marina]